MFPENVRGIFPSLHAKLISESLKHRISHASHGNQISDQVKKKKERNDPKLCSRHLSSFLVVAKVKDEFHKSVWYVERRLPQNLIAWKRWLGGDTQKSTQLRDTITSTPEGAWEQTVVLKGPWTLWNGKRRAWAPWGSVTYLGEYSQLWAQWGFLVSGSFLFPTHQQDCTHTKTFQGIHDTNKIALEKITCRFTVIKRMFF